MTEVIQMMIRRALPEEAQWGYDRQTLRKQADLLRGELPDDIWMAIYRGERVALAESLQELFAKIDELDNIPKNLVAFARLGELRTPIYKL